MDEDNRRMDQKNLENKFKSKKQERRDTYQQIDDNEANKEVIKGNKDTQRNSGTTSVDKYQSEQSQTFAQQILAKNKIN